MDFCFTLKLYRKYTPERLQQWRNLWSSFLQLRKYFLHLMEVYVQPNVTLYTSVKIRRPMHNMILCGVLGVKLNATYCIYTVNLLTKCLFTFFCPFIDRQVFLKRMSNGLLFKKNVYYVFAAAFRELDKT